ncbi:hypothetical protein AAKU64_000657 [Undibacterium sp. GrIS 1.8]
MAVKFGRTALGCIVLELTTLKPAVVVVLKDVISICEDSRQNKDGQFVLNLSKDRWTLEMLDL